MRFCQSFMCEMYHYLGPDKVIESTLFLYLYLSIHVEGLFIILFLHGYILGPSVGGDGCWYSRDGVSFWTV